MLEDRNGPLKVPIRRSPAIAKCLTLFYPDGSTSYRCPALVQLVDVHFFSSSPGVEDRTKQAPAHSRKGWLLPHSHVLNIGGESSRLREFLSQQHLAASPEEAGDNYPV